MYANNDTHNDNSSLGVKTFNIAVNTIRSMGKYISDR